METNDKITDELIAKYISGNTTEEEDNLIHDYLAQNPEFANDLLDIATALRHQQKHDEAIANEGKEQGAAHVRLIPRRTLYAAAAAIVILIGIGLLVSKPFAKNDEEQSLVAETQPGPILTPTDSIKEGEEIDPGTVPVNINEPEQPLLVDEQEFPIQKTDKVIDPTQKELYAESTPIEQPQPETDIAPSNDGEGPIMASQTIYQDDSGEPRLEDAVFVTDSIPTTCNPKKELVLRWNCNAPSLTLEFSTDNGDEKVWKKPPLSDITGKNVYTISATKLRDLMTYNKKCFYWRITAKYKEGSIKREGKVEFSD